MASTEERVGKFLRRLLQNKSAIEIAQSLVGEPKPMPPRVPGGSSVSPISLDKRWQLLNLPEARRELLDPWTVEQADKYCHAFAACGQDPACVAESAAKPWPSRGSLLRSCSTGIARSPCCPGSPLRPGAEGTRGKPVAGPGSAVRTL